MALATRAEVALPCLSKTLTGRIFASGATPAIPSPLPAAAPGDAGDQRPMAVRVLRPPVVDHAAPGHQLALEIGVFEVDAGIDHRDNHAGSLADAPGSLGPHPA